ncbi:MAG: PHP domain-containing protein, partial [Gammaproteobacteria bacterium]
MNFAELHCVSNYSFLRGASHPEELIERAQQLGYRALAVTDDCTVGGLVRAHTAAKRTGIKLVCGSEFTLECGTRIVALVPDRAGWAELCALITRGRRAAEKGRYALTRGDVEELLQRCLVILCPTAPTLEDSCEWVAGAFPGRAWLAVELHAGADDAQRLALLQRTAARHRLSAVAAGDVHMHRRGRRVLQDIVTAIRHRCTVAQAGARLFASGERHLRTLERLSGIYPAPLLAETVRIADQCRFSLDELRYEYPEEVVPPGFTPAGWLRRLTDAGLQRRWPDGAPAAVRAQVDDELALVTELGYEPYFLTVYDVVRFARERGILCQGRGSAANSAVCYCLGITEVDPSRMNMLFGRFISRERAEPPDIDVDFEHERREEVIQYIYSRYGRERAALAAVVITYRPKSAMRDVAKALGYDAANADAPAARQLAALARALHGFPRHLSQHVGGFVIARGPLHELVPVENAAMADRTVIQWDKYDIDALGLLKVDVLALGMLTAIRRTLDMLGCTMQQVPTDDAATWRMIQHADTIGVFQIESRAQMSMLPRLKPACFYDLVIEVAIVRPGPIQGNMVHPYLARRAGKVPVEYPSPELKRVLERTLGVPIFQEQVMELAMVAAGFTAGEADELRRAMAAWKRSGGLEPFEQRLKQGMMERGYTEAFAATVYGQICGFGEYGFPESHSASFALLVWVSAWLKCHHPAAFTAALVNSQPMGFYAPAQLVQDARRHGVEVRPVCVHHSDWDCTLEPATGGPALRLGLR